MPTSRNAGPVATFAASRHGVVTRSQAASMGFSKAVVAAGIRRGWWIEPSPGVLVSTSAPTTWLQQLTVVALSLEGVPVVSHAAAGRLHRLDGFETDDRLCVTVPHGRRLRMDGVEVHQVTKPFANDDVLIVDGLRCTSLARTLVDLAASEPADLIERALDDFERRELSLTWLEQTADRLHRPGQRGTTVIRAALAARRRRGTKVRGSWWQKVVKDLLASTLIPGLVEEYEIRDDRGRFVARTDLAVPLVRLGIEAHSRRYHIGLAAEARDEDRDRRVAEAGWDLTYLGFAETTSTPRQVRQHIEALVARRARDLGIPLPQQETRRK